MTRLGHWIVGVAVVAGCAKNAEQPRLESPFIVAATPDAGPQPSPGDDYLVLEADGVRYRLDDAVSVRKIKDALKLRGFDPGPIDGGPGSRLHDTLATFQTKEAALQRDRTPPIRMPRIGVVDRMTASWLGLDFEQLLSVKRPLPLLSNDSLSPDPYHSIRNSYGNNQAGEARVEKTFPSPRAKSSTKKR